VPEPPSAEAEAELPVLREPAEGVPGVVETGVQLRGAVERLVNGNGPVAVDAERASGYRYSQRAYLVQLRRAGSGTIMVDPVQLPDLAAIGTAISDAEWILHAASQDLPSLATVGLVPGKLFDTELAGRLLGEERVALGTMVERHLGIRLEKHHSAADWSTRPLPRDWLVYAALDVELLIPLRDVLAAELASAEKSEWAAQEFEAERTAPAPPLRDDPWRRTSGIHLLRNRRQLAAVRALWQARDDLAAVRDVAPGRLLPDSAIVAAARLDPSSAAQLGELPIFRGPRQRRILDRWFEALEAARALPDDALPALTGTGDGIPPTARWRDRDPAAAERLRRFREVVSRLAAEHSVLPQNLLASDIVRRLAWQPPTAVDEAGLRAELARLGARPWQVALCAGPLAATFGA
jgi:ribonuclease D